MGVIAKQSFRGTIVTYLGVAIGFVTTFFVLTRFLTSEEIGLARVMIDAATLLVGLAQLGTSASIIRFYPYFHDAQKGDHGFFFWTLFVPIIGFVLFALIYWGCHVPLSQWFGAKSPLFVDYYYLVLPIAFFMLYQTVFETNANVRMRIVVPRAVREVVTRVGMLAVYLLFAFRVLSMDGFIIGICSVYAIAALCNIVYLLSIGGISMRPDWAYIRANQSIVRRYVLYTGFLIVAAVTSVLAPSLSSFFVTAKMGLEYTGIFAIATYMAAMVSIPYRSISAIASPQLAQAIKDNDRPQTSHLMQQVSSTILLIGGFIFLIIWLNIDIIYLILPNGSTFAVAKYVVLLLSLSQLISAPCTIALSAISYSRYYAFSLALSLILTVLSIVFNNWLIPIYGMEGAAISSLAALGIYSLLAVLTLRLCTGNSPFNGQTVKIVLLLTVVMGLNKLWLMIWPEMNVWVSGLSRTFVLVGGGTLIAWRATLSPDINRAVTQWWNRHRRS